ncbi:MAG TPA: MaoC family dehydratase N-terminal domain-containing protein [Stellaceae bacterium]|nr:MaoC family dehydratase N-terminal domain-containing protein [Stellaceae bacterium]
MDLAELAKLREYVGRTEAKVDTITPVPATLHAATLDRDDPPYKAGDALPPGWHRLYFLSAVRPGELGEDGHTVRGKFMPPVPLPRRMFAGARLAFHRPLAIGDEVTRVSEIMSLEGKQGRTGDLVFVTVAQRYSVGGALALEETQDIVYRSASRGGEGGGPAEMVEPAPWQREVHPDPVMLFRYSALIFNGHRIHYDHPYVTEVEGYPGLIVHGPLIATLLLDLVRRERPGARVTGFSFRARRPLFSPDLFTVRGWPAADGRSVRLAAVNHEGAAAMTAEATLA